MAIDLVKDFLAQPESIERGVLLDGFPRTPGQAQALVHHVEVDRFILLRVSDSACIERILERRVDPETGTNYHLRFVPPPSDISARLVRREYDIDANVVQTRLRAYHEQLGNIVPHFNGKIMLVDGSKEPDQVFACTSAGISAPPSPVDVDAIVKESSADAVAAANGADEDDGWGDEVMEVQQESDLALSIVRIKDVSVHSPGTSSIAVSVQAPDCLERQPVDVCCVVDISGSMGTTASYEEADGSIRDDGLSLLDIVKHAVKTVMYMLNEQDRLALVAFDDKAERAYSLGEMTEGGRNQAVVALDQLRPRGQTDIWKALHESMEALRVPLRAGEMPRKKFILLLTDGQPNCVPPRGHITELKDYVEAHPDFSFTLNTFGFGNQLDSELLLGLATEGRGTYAFIPDAKIVGTCFVNSIANAVSTRTQSSQLHLMPRGGADFVGPVMGSLPVTDTSWGRVVDLGPLSFGQSRIVVVPLSIPGGGPEPYLEAVVVHPDQSGKDVRASVVAAHGAESVDAAAALLRSDIVSTTCQAVGNLTAGGDADVAKSAMADLRGRSERRVKLCQAPDAGARPYTIQQMVSLQTDVEGRITKALSTMERFNRWGKHYLLALARSHQLQQCTNFMDPGLQAYGGTLFKEVRDRGGEIFKSLPAPTPAQDETGIPCDQCGAIVSFSSYASHVCGRRAPAARPSAVRAPSPQGPAMDTYYAGSGGG
jgi:adenylate kinase family enzyme/Mg-chelatase subunit ChlD